MSEQAGSSRQVRRVSPFRANRFRQRNNGNRQLIAKIARLEKSWNTLTQMYKVIQKEYNEMRVKISDVNFKLFNQEQELAEITETEYEAQSLLQTHAVLKTDLNEKVDEVKNQHNEKIMAIKKAIFDIKNEVGPWNKNIMESEEADLLFKKIEDLL